MSSSDPTGRRTCPRVASARATGARALADAMEFARTCAVGAVLGNWRGRRLDPEGRDDVVQETLARILHGVTRTEKPVQDLQDWVRGTVDLVLKERWKERDRRARDASPVPVDAEEPREPRPDEVLLGRERSELVRACLDRLPDHYRRMLLLRYVDRLTNSVIAERIGKTEKAVEGAVPRALALVRQCLERKKLNP